MSAQALIILNLSDESFSDGGQLSSGSVFAQRLRELSKLGFHAFDIGAQSTAPNRTRMIDLEEECQRFISIFEEAMRIDENLWEGTSFLSLDTFRPATFIKIFKWLRANGYKGPIAMNDVSGRYREGVEETLNTLGELFTYILCHNRVPSRGETPFHMKHQQPTGRSDILDEVQVFFEEGSTFLHKLFPTDHLIFDPALGFAKSYAENWAILEGVARLNPKGSLLLGISRKSFLRQRVREVVPGVSDAEAMKLSEFYHYDFIKKWSRELKGNFWVRIHDPHLGLLALGNAI